MDIEKLILRLKIECDKKAFELAVIARPKCSPLRYDFLEKYFELLKVMDRRFKETERMIRDGKVAYPAVISESERKVLDLYVRGEFDGKDNNQNRRC